MATSTERQNNEYKLKRCTTEINLIVGDYRPDCGRLEDEGNTAASLGDIDEKKIILSFVLRNILWCLGVLLPARKWWENMYSCSVLGSCSRLKYKMRCLHVRYA